MTSKGQVLIPKALRDQIGLRPGKPVAVGLNELGQIVVVTPEEARRRGETADERRLRIRAAVASV
ncbi:MAG: AbrB/MazE/SpoVT family DNA-binding domain-containing protein, partial [Sphingomonas sp.]